VAWADKQAEPSGLPAGVILVPIAIGIGAFWFKPKSTKQGATYFTTKYKKAQRLPLHGLPSYFTGKERRQEEQ
jgi:hypothetical protein